jgi:hypothetical protein
MPHELDGECEWRMILICVSFHLLETHLNLKRSLAEKQDQISIAIIIKGGFHFFSLIQKPIHQNESFLSMT